ncbi:MAG: Uma2 family endonuclease, partial [Crocosphaera sp.]
MGIYSGLGITEIWRYDGQVLRIYQLVKEEYKESDKSDIFSFLKSKDIMRFLQQSQKGEIALMKAFRLWVKEQLGKLKKS